MQPRRLCRQTEAAAPPFLHFMRPATPASLKNAPSHLHPASRIFVIARRAQFCARRGKIPIFQFLPQRYRIIAQKRQVFPVVFCVKLFLFYMPSGVPRFSRTACISREPLMKLQERSAGAKDPLTAAADLFRGSLIICVFVSTPTIDR